MGAGGPAGQLPFDLPIEPRFGRDDFLPAASNQAALAMVDKWPDWPDRSLLMIGPPGSGKSHLIAIWAKRAGALRVDPAAIPEIAELAAAAPTAISIDGVDLATNETAFFHLLNFVLEHRTFLLMSAARRIRPEDVRLPDLLSRLRRSPVVEIGAPDDALMRAVLEKLFRDRQLLVEAPALDYAALRLERSLEAARAFVAALDQEALAQGRAATRALVADVIGRFAAEDGG